jgi:hypothetical protein
VRLHPDGAGRDDDPGWRFGTAAGTRAVTGLLSSYLTPSADRLILTQNASRLDLGGKERESRKSAVLPVCSDVDLHPVGLGTKRAATLRSVRAAVRGSNGAARATGDQREPNERRGGDGAVRFAVGAEVCGAVGCNRSDGLMRVVLDGESRTLCPVHVRRWSA